MQSVGRGAALGASVFRPERRSQAPQTGALTPPRLQGAAFGRSALQAPQSGRPGPKTLSVTTAPVLRRARYRWSLTCDLALCR